MFTLHISTDNAAFEKDDEDAYFPNEVRAIEIARILREIAGELDNGADSSGSAFDINGNDVGEWAITS